MVAIFSIRYIFLEILCCLYIVSNCNSNQFNLYYTKDRSHKLYRDCLYHFTSDDTTVPQFIRYCIDSTSDEIQLTKSPHYDQSLTFEELHKQNISSYQLYTWSAPIDLAEYYQIYLDKNLLIDEFIFYNCTYPWFGTYCEYSFDKTRAELSFLHQVQLSLLEKDLTTSYIPENLPCYTHLICDRTGADPPVPGACLGWREICDGRINCLDNTHDEEHCWQLEINECDPHTEFRCHNGQCIPISFLNDDIHNPDCLDRSDEYVSGPYSETDLLGISRSITRECYLNPAFKCEEHVERLQQRVQSVFGSMVECGDGLSTNIITGFCQNGRDALLLKTTIAAANLSDQCRMAFDCVIGYYVLYSVYDSEYFGDCKFDNSKYVAIFQRECPPLIELGPMIYGVVRFVYSNNVSKAADKNLYEVFPPDYVCYNKSLCEDALVLPLMQYTHIDLFNNNSTCVATKDLLMPNSLVDWLGLVRKVYSLFSECSTPFESSLMANRSNLYSCVNSSKIISQHRLKDAIKDCLYGDDESYENSCLLNNNQHRFKCIDQNKNIACFSHSIVGNRHHDCFDQSDEKVLNEEPLSKTTVSFQTMCDGFTELLPILIDGKNETDETECSRFPCNNTYTRCDGTWNCPNGADEVNCEWPPLCPSSYHMCISKITSNLTCLPIKHVNDGIADCFGSFDERQFCRENGSNPVTLYRCENTDRCITAMAACDPFNSCSPGNVTLKFCNMLPHTHPFCEFGRKLNYVEQVLCSLSDSRKKTFLHLSLIVNSSSQWALESTERSTASVATDKLSRQAFTIHKQRFGNNLARSKFGNFTRRNASMIWRCNRGVIVNRWNKTINDSQIFCLCPPAYYGRLCQYENQRVSLTIQVQATFDWRVLFTIVIILRDDEQGLIESHDQINYLATHNCDRKFNVYLLYGTRPKNSSKNYIVHIDVYNKNTLKYRSSSLFTIAFPFLPVNRLAVKLQIPIMESQTEENCTSLKCGIHGHSLKYENMNKSFCQCEQGWFGASCNIQYSCNCSSDGLCIGPSMCLCPAGKFGSFCHLKYSKCQCDNGGSCLLIDERMNEDNRTICACQEGFSGRRCENIDTQIVIRFASEIPMPKSILLHFIEVFGTHKSPIRSTIFRKIEVYQEMVIVFRSRPFHIMFVEIDHHIYHRMIVQEKYISSTTIASTVQHSNRCPHIRELFNESFSKMHLLRRMKYYHIPCQNGSDLSCFYDDIHMCICNSDLRQANCFTFDHNTTYNCQERNICENNGRCFDDYKKCPTLSMCICDDCSYGSRCQFSTKGFEISLDVILGYHIQQNVSVSQQRFLIKITIAITAILLVLGLLSGILSILTFRSKELRNTSCGLYLLTSSIIVIIIVMVFAFKFYILIASQMLLIANTKYLALNCMINDFVIKSLLNAIDWLNASVNVERAIIAQHETNYNVKKHRKNAKWIIIIIWIVVITTNIQDPINRRLIDDAEDHRLWCIVQYTPNVRLFNSVILLTHFFVPFLLNIICACVVIHSLARHRSAAQRKTTYTQQLRKQIQDLKHILIIPMIFILLAVPRLIISFISGCMKSARNPWLFLFAYLASFVPSIFIFIFVLFSENYKKQFVETMKRLKNSILRR